MATYSPTDMFLETDDGTGKSVFHGGFMYLDRIDEILKNLDHLRVHISYSPQNKSIELYAGILAWLTNLYYELVPKMTKNERAVQERMFYTAKQEYNNFMTESRNKALTTMEFIDTFHNWEIQLRCIVEDKGLLMAEKRGGLGAAMA